MTEGFKEALDSEFPFMAEVGLECGKGWYPLIRELCDGHYREKENCL